MRNSRTVLMLLNTSGVQYDDRVRKECASLLRCGWRPMVCALESANRANDWVDMGGVMVRVIALNTRRMFPSTKGLTFKVAEMYVKFIVQVLRVRPEVLWLHNLELAGLVPFCLVVRRLGLVKCLIWDQHELPPQTVAKTPWLRRLWNWMISSCDAVVVAAKERRDWLHERRLFNRSERVFVLENFADATCAEMPVHELPLAIRDWVGDSGYWLAQGGGAPDRHLEPLVEAVVALRKRKLVVVGVVEPRLMEHLRRRFGESLTSWVWITGMVPQREVPYYIDHASASIVFYAKHDDNNWWCAPNRLYQALSRGVPVIVGANPPMHRAVEQTRAGIALSGDGSDSREIVLALRRMDVEGAEIFRSAESSRRRYRWEAQDSVFAEILGICDHGRSVLGDAR